MQGGFKKTSECSIDFDPVLQGHGLKEIIMETEIHLQRCTVALLIPKEILEKTNRHVIGVAKHYIHAVDCVVIKNTKRIFISVCKCL